MNTIIRQATAAVSFFIASSVTLVHADEVSVQVHSGEENNSIGYSFNYSDNISTNQHWRWGVGYSYLDELKAVHNGEEAFFNNSNIDGYLAYRFSLRSYNAFWRPFNFEFQAGASVSLTENKFIFENFPDQEIGFSDRGDVNLFAAAITQYKLTKEVQLQLGYKYYPDFSDFDDQSSVFIGFTYHFGRKFSY